MLFTSRHIHLIKRLFLLLIPYSFLRVGFYFYHLGVYKQFTQEDIFQSFLYGIRFDLAAICILNASVILLALIPSKNTKFLKLDRLWFSIVNTLGFGMVLLDYELFLFMGKRLSSDIFAVTDDIIQQAPQIILYYWYFPLIALGLGMIVFYLDKNLLSLKRDSANFFSVIIGGVLVLGLSFIAIRGGLQSKSINVQSAFIQGKNELGHLVVNTPYHFFRTFKNKRVERLNYFASDDEAKNVILNHRQLRRDFKPFPKSNIVLIILESFALEYVEKGYAPFLNELKDRSLFLERNLANGRRSIEVLPSVLCGLPSLIDDPLSKSTFSANKFTCFPKVLKAQGYTNHFFHAGTRGTMGFESYTLANGFDRYFSREDYPGEDYDGTWGIFDGPYLQYVARELGQTPEPFLSGIFTLSSHQPYSIPEEMKGKFDKGTLEIHESIQYTDLALRKFFEQVKDKPWFKRTLFIITADHVQKLETKKFQNMVGQYRVPLLLYAPGQNWEGISQDKVTQHADIPDTVLEYLGLQSDELPATGRSVLSGNGGMAINYADGRTYFLIESNKVLALDKNNQQKIYSYDWKTGDLIPQGDSQESTLRAYMQYYINGLINNNLSLYR